MSAPPNLLEEELLDVLRSAGELSGFKLGKVLGWGTAKLYPVLAALEDRKVITARWASAGYPRTRLYKLMES